MAELTPIRRIERVPPWTVPNVNALAFDTPNGRLLVAGRRDLRALSLEDGREVMRSENEGSTALDRSYCISVGARRAAALVNEELIAWDTITGRIVSRAPVPGAAWLDSISDDGTRAAIASLDQVDPTTLVNRLFADRVRVSVIDVETGRLRVNLGVVNAATQRSTLLLRDGGVLLLERTGGLIEYDARGTIVRRHAALPPEAPQDDREPAPTLPAAFGAGDFTNSFTEIVPLAGDLVLCRSLSNTALRNRLTGARHLSLGSGLMESIIPTGDGRALLRRTNSPRPTEVRLDVFTGAVEPLAGYGVIGWTVCVEENGVIATAEYPGNIRLLRRGEPHTLSIPLDVIPSHPESVAISPDGSTVLVGCYDGSVRVLEGERIRALPGHVGQTGGAGFLEDGRMWTSSADHHRVWSRSGRVEIDEAFLGSSYGNPTTSPSGALLYGVRDASVTVRSSQTGRVIRDRVLGSMNLREGAGLLDDGTTFFSVSDQGVFRWNLETGERTAELPRAELEREPSWVTFNASPEPTGARVLLHSPMTMTMLWEPDTGRIRVVPKIRGASRARWFGNRILLLGAHEDDTSVLAPDCRIHVLDADTLERVDVLTGPEEPIRTFTSAGPFVCAIGEDRKIAIWRHGVAG